jgi:copper chaperone CopZ
MKTIKIFSIIILCCYFTTASFAQKKTETMKVSGECGMCKSKIEKAAKSAGASYAVWDVDTKTLTVKYNSKSTNAAKIQQSVAGSGYDTPDYKATDEAYNNLHACCKYERETGNPATGDCCKDGKCTREGHEGKDCCKKVSTSKMDCCKDGKCSKEGHNGKDCCKKS